MAIYNVVVLCAVTAPVTLIIGHQENAIFAFVAVAVCLCCFLSLGLLFLPKVCAVINRPNEGAEASTLTDTAGSKEEEERHARLLGENELLKSQIAEVRMSGSRPK